ncbi:MAG: hypothetical protein NT118_01645 [Lentisphaerae bacterium]|nr:hypothetical protein [Lentisphaerota bacterium]
MLKLLCRWGVIGLVVFMIWPSVIHEGVHNLAFLDLARQATSTGWTDWGLGLRAMSPKSLSASIVKPIGLWLTDMPSENQALFVDTAVYLSFIAGVVIRRDLWLARDKESYYGTLFVHVGVIFQEPLPGSTRVIAEPLIAIRQANISWSARVFEIWMFKWPCLIWFFKYSDSAKSKVIPREPWRNLQRLMSYRARDFYSISEFRRLIEPSQAASSYKFAARVIAHLPVYVLSLCALCFTIW